MSEIPETADKKGLGIAAKILGIAGICIVMAIGTLQVVYVIFFLMFFPALQGMSSYNMLLTFYIAGPALLGLAFLFYGIIRKDKLLILIAILTFAPIIPAVLNNFFIIQYLPIPYLISGFRFAILDFLLDLVNLVPLIHFMLLFTMAPTLVYIHLRKYESKVHRLIITYGGLGAITIVYLTWNIMGILLPYIAVMPLAFSFYFQVLLLIWFIKQDATSQTPAERAADKITEKTGIAKQKKVEKDMLDRAKAERDKVKAEQEAEKERVKSKAKEQERLRKEQERKAKLAGQAATLKERIINASQTYDTIHYKHLASLLKCKKELLLDVISELKAEGALNVRIEFPTIIFEKE